MSFSMLFNDGDWSIHEVPKASLATLFAYHHACKRARKYTIAQNHWWLGDTIPNCAICKEKVPDDIQTLIILYDYGKEE